MTINQIAMVSIPVSDQQAAKSFYTGVLDFEIVRENPMGPDQHWIELAPNGAGTSITLVTWFEGMPPGCVDGTVLQTDDIEATHAELRERGLEITPIEQVPWGATATFSDPDGNGWVLQQPADDA